MPQVVVETRQLTKRYRSGRTWVNALNQVDLTIQEGEIFGYLGPNGAGKTTTIRILLDIIRPTEGHAAIFGLDSRQSALVIHRRIGFLPGELNLWKNQTAQEIIAYIARLRGDAPTQLKAAADLADRLKLDVRKRMRDYSTGNKRKLGLVLALMHQPQLLILDEPTSGLDPLLQQTFNEMMREIRQQGRTVFLSSHMLGEVQAICDRVAILRDGEIKAVESVEALRHVGYRDVRIATRAPLETQSLEALRQATGVIEVSTNGHGIRLKLSGDFDPVLRALAGHYITDISTQEPTLEDIFLRFYGDEAAEKGA